MWLGGWAIGWSGGWVARLTSGSRHKSFRCHRRPSSVVRRRQQESQAVTDYTTSQALLPKLRFSSSQLADQI